jgi:uncharacterized protein
MAIHFVPLQALRRRRRWEFVQPIRIRELGGSWMLLLHPPSGSWAILPLEKRPAVEALMKAAEEGALDRTPEVDDHPLLGELVRTGLLMKDGRTSWSAADLDQSARPVSMLILKMVGYCNLACTYCYDYNGVTYKRRMSAETAERAISGALERAGGGLTVLFHGGEPLLAFDAVRSAVAFARARAAELGKGVRFSIQTNGTCFTAPVVEFLVAEEFSVGVSLDGPAALNDRLRVDHAGRGHFQAIEGALLEYPELREQVGILTTVTRHNVRHLARVADYVGGLGVRTWDTTVFQPAGRGEGRSDEFAPDTDELVQAYLELLDGVEAGRFDELEVCPVLHYLRNVLTLAHRNMCMRGGGCGAGRDLVSVSVDGTVEACDCIRNPALTLGSIERGIGAALDTPVAREIRARSEATLRPCATCDVRVFCGGSCLAKAGAVDAVDDQECRLALAMYPAIFERLARSDALERYARRHP